MNHSYNSTPQTYNEQDLQNLIIELQESKANLEAHRFVESALARFSSIIRFQADDTLEKWADRIMDELVSCVNGLQGAFYVAEENEYYQAQLKLIGAFAYDKKAMKNVIPFGEGIVGQAAKSQKSYFLNASYELQPKTYSSLAQLELKSIIIQPLIFNDKVEGLIEIASSVEFSPQEVELVRSLSENIAANLRSVQQQATLKQLYEETQKRAAQLEAQEEAMRQSVEELQATQNEMKRVQQELKAQDDAINRACATAQLDLEGNILFCNPTYARISGYTQEELIMQPLQKLWMPDSSQETDYKQFLHRLQQGDVIIGRFGRLNKEGAPYWIQASYSPILGHDKRPVRIAEFAWDVTEKVQAELELEQTRAELQNQLEAINRHNAVIELDPQGLVLHVNRNYLRLCGLTTEEIIGKPFTQFIAEEQLKAIGFNRLWEQLQAGKPANGEIKLRNQNGQIVWLHASMSPILNIEGALSKVLLLAYDITQTKEQTLLLQKTMLAYRRHEEERKKTKEMLRLASEEIRKLQTEKRLYETALNQYLAHVSLDKKGNLTGGNDVFFRLLQLPAELAIGRHWSDFFSAPNTDAELWQNWLNGKAEMPENLQIRLPKGQGKTTECKAFWYLQNAKEEDLKANLFFPAKDIKNQT
jgi:PAS domain S-box-containing protein